VTDDNNHVPTRVVQQIIDWMKFSQEKTDREINELTRVMTKVVNNLNTPPRLEDLDERISTVGEKLEESIGKMNKMVLVIKVTFVMLSLAVVLAVFGSNFLYKRNSEFLIQEIMKKTKVIEERIDKKDVEKIIKDYIEKEE